MLHVCVCVTGRTSMSSTSSNQTVIGCHANPMLFLRMLAPSTWCSASYVGGGAGVRQEERGDREYFDEEKWQIVPVQDEARDAAGTRTDSNCQSSDPAPDFLMLARPGWPGSCDVNTPIVDIYRAQCGLGLFWEGRARLLSQWVSFLENILSLQSQLVHS